MVAVQLAVPRDVHAFGVAAREPGRWAADGKACRTSAIPMKE